MNKNKIINQAQRYISKGQWDKAIRELQKLVDHDPNDVRTLLKLGDVYSKKGDRPNATKIYKQVAESYSEQGFFLKAVAVYKQILKHDSKHLEVTLKLAELYEHLGLTSEAMSQYQNAAAIHDDKGDTKQSLDVLKRMVELDSDNVASRIKLAEGYSMAGMVPDAIQEFQRAATLLKKANRIDDYIKVAERLMYHDPSQLDVVRDLAKLYIDRGDTKRGLAKLQLCFKADPRDINTLNMLARAFTDLGQVQKTIFVYKELARVYQENSNETESRRTLERILELDPNDPEVRAALNSTPEPPAGIPSSGIPSARSNPGLAPKLPNSPRITTPSFRMPSVPPAPPPPNAIPAHPSPVAPALDPQHLGSGDWNAAPGSVPEEFPSSQFEPPAPLPAPTFAGGNDFLNPATLPPVMPSDGPPGSPQSAPSPLGAGLPSPSLAPRPPPPRGLESGSLVSSDEVLSFEDDSSGHPSDPGLRSPRANRPASVSDSSMQIQKILTETDVYIKYGLKEKALEHLRRIFEIDNDNGQAYEKMRDIHLSGGNFAQAAEAVSNMMRVYQRQGDDRAAASARSELARLAPGHPLLNASGAQQKFGAQEVSDNISIDITEDSDAFELVDVVEDAPTLPPQRGHQPSENADAMFAVVEPNAESQSEPPIEAAPEIPPPRSSGPPHAYATADLDLDLNLDPIPEPQVDHFESKVSNEGLIVEDAIDFQEPEPTDDAFELEGNSGDNLSSLSEAFEASRELGESTEELSESDIAEAREDDLLDDPFETTQESEIAKPVEYPDFDDEIAEAEFMIEAEVYDDAKEILDQILAKAPGHPKAVALLSQINGHASSPSPSSPPPEQSQGWEVAQLAGHSEAQTNPGIQTPPEFSSEDVGDAFGALEEPSESPGEDLQHRFDEGMMYKEIGRLDAAIDAFKAASMSSGRSIDSLEMIGHCYLEQRDYPNAIEFFARALEQGASGAAAINLKYEIGVAYELSGDMDGAVQWFKACHLDAPEHRDVEQKLLNLASLTPGEDETVVGQSHKANGHVKDSENDDPPNNPGPKKSKISYI